MRTLCIIVLDALKDTSLVLRSVVRQWVSFTSSLALACSQDWDRLPVRTIHVFWPKSSRTCLIGITNNLFVLNVEDAHRPILITVAKQKAANNRYLILRLSYSPEPAEARDIQKPSFITAQNNKTNRNKSILLNCHAQTEHQCLFI